MEFRPKRVKAELFPYDDVDCTRLAQCLHGVGLIKVYEVDGESYIWVPTFTKHQTPHMKEKAKGYPDYSDAYVAAPDKHQTGPVQAQLNPESGYLNPDVLNEECPRVAPTPPKKAKSNATPKTRLTDWLEASGGCPPESLGEWANTNLGWDSERISREWEAFADYWTSGNAVDGGRKSDWPATWRGSCRRQADRYPSQQRGAGGSQPSKLVAISSAVLAGRMAKQGADGGATGTRAGAGSPDEAGHGHDLQALEADLPEWARGAGGFDSRGE